MKKSKVLLSLVAVLFTCALLAITLTACSLGGHTHTPSAAVKENEVAATCTTDGGYDEVVYCSVCNAEISRTHKTVAKCHTPSAAVKKNEVAATCKATGSYEEVVYCAVCGKEISRTPKSTDKLTTHTPSAAVKKNEVAATCKADGSYDEVVYCAVCGKEISRTPKSTDKLTTHTSATAVKENEVAATCKATGSYEEVVYCAVCGKEISRTPKSTDKLTTHTPSTAVKENEVAATCTTDGGYDKVVYCSVCNAEISRTYKTVAKGHTPADAVRENETPATCTTEGNCEEVVYCSACGDEISRTPKIIGKTHNVQNGVCSGCGAKESTAGLKFSLNADGTGYTVTKIGTCTASNIVIDLYNNMSVTSIGSYAFYKCTSLKSVTIGNGVTSIGNYAFEVCYKLVEVINKSSLNITTGSSDNGCVAYYAKEVKKDGESKIVNYKNTGYLFYTTESGENYLIGYIGKDKHLTLPEHYNGKNYVINDYAFYMRNDITSITIPDSVTSIGEVAFYECTSLTSITIPDSVTSIGSSAFYGCYKLVEVINKSKLNITAGSSNNGYVAYYAKEVHRGESKIVNYNNTVYLFYTYNGVNYLLGYTGNDKALTLPESYNGENYEIYKYAFYNRDDITSVTIPNSVTSIGEKAFYGCYKLKEVINKSSLTVKNYRDNGYIAYYAIEVHTGESKIVNYNNTGYLFYTTESGTNYLIDYIGNEKDLTLPESYNGEKYGICGHAFYERTNITSVVIPNAVTRIGGSAFEDCTSLTSVTIPESVTYIGSYAFSYCTSLTSVTIPDSVTTIDDHAFRSCGLTRITMGTGVTKIGQYAFDFCTKLEGVYISDMEKWCNISFMTSDRINSIGDLTANPLYFAHDLYLNGELVTDLVIPEGVTCIGQCVFSGCTSITSVTIPDSVTSAINRNAFAYCNNLTSVTIGDSVTGIAIYAFYNCTGLQSVSIGDGVKSIGWHAFERCTGLKSVMIGKSLKSIGGYAFEDCESLTHVFYNGTNSEYMNQKIQTDSNNTYYRNAPNYYYYSETAPTETGKYWHYGENGEIVVWGE